MSNISLKTFFKNKHKGYTLLVWWLTAFYRARMVFIPSKYLEKYWGDKNMESSETETENHLWTARFIGREVNRVADLTPWESKCMIRALTAQYLLHRKGIPSTMYLGVGKDDDGNMIAHAWIRCGEYYVTGGDGKGLAIVGKFRK